MHKAAQLTSCGMACRALFVLHREEEMQVGLTAEEKQQLEDFTLDQLLATFRAESFKVSSGSSAYRGVSFHKGRQKFQVRISIKSKQITLGYFETEAQAARAYDAAGILHLGRC